MLVFFLTTNDGAWVRLEQLIKAERYAVILGYGGIWAAAVACTLIAAFLPRTGLRLLWAVVICTSAFIGDAFIHIVREFINYDYVELLWVARSDAGNAFAAYGDRLGWPFFRAVVGFAAIVAVPVSVSIPAPLSFSMPMKVRRWLGAAPLVPAAMIGGVIVITGGYGTQGLPQQFTPAAISVLVLGQAAVSDYGGGRREVSIPLRQPRRANHVVLIVDESIRGDFLGLNGPAGTTPYLKSQGDRLTNFGLAASGNNCSHFSNAIMRLGGTRKNLAESIRTSPTIWKYAKKAGYRTVYLDGQHVGGYLQNFISDSEKAAIDDFLQLGGEPLDEADLRIARHLGKILASPEPHFIMINKSGAHIPYENFYPEDRAFFSPHMGPGEKIGKSRERLINSYKNATRWSVDNFFETLLPAVGLDDAVILYTSDHGQNLMDRGIVTHCRYANPHPAEGVVPMVVFTDRKDLRAGFEKSAGINKNKTSHFNLFPTLLYLFGYDRAKVLARYGPGLMDPITDEPAFSSGTVFPRFGRSIQWNPLGDFFQDLAETNANTNPPGVPR